MALCILYFVRVPVEANGAPQKSRCEPPPPSDRLGERRGCVPALELVGGTLPEQHNKSGREGEQSSSKSRKTILIPVPF